MKIFKIYKLLNKFNTVGLRNIYFDYFKFKKLKIPLKEVLNLKQKDTSKKNSILFGKEIKITDSFWYLHSLNELFIEEIYRFNSKKDNPKIIDCGSNMGLSIIYFLKLYPNSQIIGFEPDDDIFKMMQFNLSQFDIKNVQLYQKAVWVNEEPLLFNKIGSLSGHVTDVVNNNTISIETVRLKTLLKDGVDFLKIDIEGSEFDIIKDCEDVLSNVENIFVEYHSFKEYPQMIGELLIILKTAGFKIYIKEAWENMKNPFLERNETYFDLQLNIFGYRC